MLQVVKQTDQGGIPSAVTRAVVDELVARRIEQYPADIVELAKQCVTDFLAVTLAGTRETGSQAVAAELLDGRDGDGPATLIGLAQRASALDAALINGMAAHALDYDDVSLPMSAHASVVILPALLALAEKRKASGRQVLESFVAGYEAGSRIGMYMAPTHYDHGFHGTGTIGTFAATAACAHLMRLDADRTERAIGIAAAQAAGIRVDVRHRLQAAACRQGCVQRPVRRAAGGARFHLCDRIGRMRQRLCRDACRRTRWRRCVWRTRGRILSAAESLQVSCRLLHDPCGRQCDLRDDEGAWAVAGCGRAHRGHRRPVAEQRLQYRRTRIPDSA